MSTETPSIEVGTFLENSANLGGFVYRVEELICDSRAKVAVYSWGLARENVQNLNSGDVTLVSREFLESLFRITQQRAEDIIGKTLQ